MLKSFYNVFTLSKWSVNDKFVLSRLHSFVIRSVAIKVSNGVYSPRGVKSKNVTEADAGEEGMQNALIPKQIRNESRKEKPEDDHQRKVVPMLKHDHWILT